MSSPIPLLQDKLFEALMSSGEQPYRAKMVANFVGSCYGLLHQAHQKLTTTEQWHEFLKKEGALTPKRKKTPSKTPANVSETAISADLSLIANQLLELPREGDSYLTSKWAISTTVPDQSTPSAHATGSRSKRPDIVFHPASAETRIKFCLESKIVKLISHIEKELLGKSGFGCFVRKTDPYESNGIVGLVGYAQQTDVPFFVKSAEEKIKSSPLFNSAELKRYATTFNSSNYINEIVVAGINDTTQAQKVCLTSMLGFDLTPIADKVPHQPA